MPTEQLPTPELPVFESYPEPYLEATLRQYNLLTPDQSTIFMVYDRDGEFTHVHKFTTRSTPQGLEIKYVDNENFINKTESPADREDYNYVTTLVYQGGQFAVTETSPIIRELLYVTREGYVEDLQEARTQLGNQGVDIRTSGLPAEVRTRLESGQTTPELLAYIDNELEKIARGQFDDEQMIIHRVFDELIRSVDDAERSAAEVISGDRKSVAKQLYQWGQARRADLD